MLHKHKKQQQKQQKTKQKTTLINVHLLLFQGKIWIQW